jgi:glutamate formiminotransferase/formiminotetrahydrofolate cyclodeaminase
MIINEPLQNFLDKLASNAPTPGGGSVAALTGSLGAGLVTMVTCLTTGKEKYKAVQPQIDELLKKAEKARSELQALIQKDIDVFGSLSLVYAMPKITEAEKAARTTKMQEVLKAACQVPFEIGEKALEVAKLAKTAAEIGNAAAVSDAGVAVLLANCCAQSAALNVKINVNSIKDAEYNKVTWTRMQAILAETEALQKTIIAITYQKMS